PSGTLDLNSHKGRKAPSTRSAIDLASPASRPGWGREPSSTAIVADTRYGECTHARFSAARALAELQRAIRAHASSSRPGLPATGEVRTVLDGVCTRGPIRSTCATGEGFDKASRDWLRRRSAICGARNG